MTIVSSLHSKAVFGRRTDVLARHLSELIPRDAQVLDVGCGDGTIASRILRHRSDVRIKGIDVLVRPTTHIEVQEFDGATIPYESDTFDAAILVDVLHHADGPLELLREVARVSNQVVLLKDHLADGRLAVPTLRAMDWVGNASHGVALPYNYLKRAEWSALFDEVGLEVTSERVDLGLYAIPASWLFDRELHALWQLRLI